MARTSGGGGSNYNKKKYPTYESRVQAVGDNRGTSIDGYPKSIHTANSAASWNRAYARAFGQFDPVRAKGGVAGNGAKYGYNTPDPMRNKQGVKSFAVDARAKVSNAQRDYANYGLHLAGARKATVAKAGVAADRNKSRASAARSAASAQRKRNAK